MTDVQRGLLDGIVKFGRATRQIGLCAKMLGVAFMTPEMKELFANLKKYEDLVSKSKPTSRKRKYKKGVRRK